MTKLDVLDTFSTIKIATAYINPDTGEKLESFPADLDLLSGVKVEYTEMKGWGKTTTGITTFSELPKEAQEYIEFIDKFIGVHVCSLSSC